MLTASSVESREPEVCQDAKITPVCMITVVARRAYLQTVGSATHVGRGLSQLAVGRVHLHFPVSNLICPVAGDETRYGQLHLVGSDANLRHGGVVVTVLQVVKIDQLVLRKIICLK